MAEVLSATGVIRRVRPQLSCAENRVASFVLANVDEVPQLSVREIARGSGTSTATVSRFIRHVGYQSFSDLRLAIARECNMLEEPVGRAIERRARPTFSVSVLAVVCDPSEERMLVAATAGGSHALLSGLVERGETLEQAAKRVVREASGLEVDVRSFAGSRFMATDNSLATCFLCYASDGGAASAGLSGGLLWVPIDKAPLMFDRGSVSYWFVRNLRSRG